MSQAPTNTTEEALRTMELTPTERHSLLADGRRRLAIAILAEKRSPIGRTDLAAEITRRETGADPDDDLIKDVLTSLHHIHLPKMASVGVIDAYPENKLIALTEPPDLQSVSHE